MPICAIGEIKRHPDGKWYRKAHETMLCRDCAFYPDGKCPSKDESSLSSKRAIEDGGNIM